MDAERLPQYCCGMPVKPTKRPQTGDVITSKLGLAYELGAELGRGGFGRAFCCADEFELQMVAKYLLPKRRPRGEVEAAWEREVSLMRAVRHPHVVNLFDAFHDINRYWIVMERCDGSVRNLVESTVPHLGLSEAQVVDFGRQVLSALHAIHAARIVHRDVHIDNVLYVFREDRIELKVSDFGISKLLLDDEGDHAYTRIGRGFDVAPELVTLKYTSQQSDIYQTGLLLYYLLTGKPAISLGDGDASVVIASGLARKRAEELHSPLGAVIAKMLRRRDDYRYATALDAWRTLASVPV